MKRGVSITFAVLFALAWGQMQFIRGFDAGADTSLCVWTSMMEHKKGSEIPACQRIWVKDPSLVMTRGWRQITGDAVP